MSQTFAQFVPANAHSFLSAAAAAITPWYPVVSGDIRNALVLLLSFVFVCFAIAVVVYRADPPAYIAHEAPDAATSRELEAQIPSPAQATDSQLLLTLEHAIEQGRASLDFDVAASPNQQPANHAHEEIPSPLAQIASHFDNVLPEPATKRDQVSHGAFGAAKGNGVELDPAKSVPQETTHVSLPRLSDLRGMRFTHALRALDIAKRHASPGNGNETLMSAIAPFESMFSLTESSNAQNGNSHEAVFAELEPPDAMRTFLPVSDPGILPEAEDGVAANGTSGGKRNPMYSKYFPPRPAAPAKSTGRRGEENERPRTEQKVARQKPGSSFDQIQILPSRRGQYNKKKS